jgi:hypothetical protein
MHAAPIIPSHVQLSLQLPHPRRDGPGTLRFVGKADPIVVDRDEGAPVCTLYRDACRAGVGMPHHVADSFPENLQDVVDERPGAVQLRPYREPGTRTSTDRSRTRHPALQPSTRAWSAPHTLPPAPRRRESTGSGRRSTRSWETPSGSKYGESFRCPHSGLPCRAVFRDSSLVPHQRTFEQNRQRICASALAGRGP